MEKAYLGYLRGEGCAVAEREIWGGKVWGERERDTNRERERHE